MLRAFTITKSYAKSARVRVFILSVFILLIPLFVYFSLHVSNRTNYFNDRNFRQLRNFSWQVTDRVDILGIVFSNAVDKFVKSSSGQYSATKSKSGSNASKEFQKYLDILRADGTNFAATRVDPIPDLGADADLGLRVNINVTSEDATPWLYFDCAGTPPVASDKNRKSDQTNAGSVRFVAKTDFDQLIRPLISKAQDEGTLEPESGAEFDHIILARPDNGKVLFQEGTDHLTITSLDHISLADSPGKTVDFNAQSLTTNAADVSIGGAQYKLYLQPVQISLSTKDSNTPDTLWVICGLVESGRFRYQTWAISYTLLIICAFTFGLLILSWPFLKLIFIGAKDRLHAGEPYILALAVVIIGSLLTFFILFVVTYRGLESELDDQLHNLADEIHQNFRQEVGSAIAEIDSLDSQKLSRGEFENITRSGMLNEICPMGKCQKEDPYPYFKTAFWIDAEGQQIAKWSISDQTTKRVSVVSRDYFSRLRDGSYRELDGHKFWLEPVNSKNTGGYTVVISKDAKPSTDLKAIVVAIDTNLMSLVKPAMVAGFGYRIVDANGDVLFPQVRENFFEECENDHRLRSAVSGHLTDFVSVPYLGRDSRLYIRPMDGLPDWTLIVFRDKEPLRSTYMEIVALSAGMFLIYLFPLVLILMIMFLISLYTGRRMNWIWPSSNLSSIYLQSVPISMFFCIVAYGASRVLSDYWLIPLLSLLSVAALLALVAQLKRRWVLKSSIRLASFLQRWPRINYRSLSSLCLVTLVFVIGVLPSLAFFRLTYNEEIALFIKYGQFTLVRSLNEREERVRAAYPGSMFKDKNGAEDKAAAATFIDRRLGQNLDRYCAFFFDTHISDSEHEKKGLKDESQAGLLLELSKLMPLSSESSIVRHGLIGNQSADDLWRWGSGNGPNFILQTPRARNTGSGITYLGIESRLPQLNLRLVPLLISLALIILILFVLIRFVLSKVFLLDTIEPSNSETNRRILSPGALRLFIVLGSPYTRRDILLQQPNLKVLNLKTEATGTKWLQKLDLDKILSESAAQSIAIDCFEHRIDEPQSNLQKLCLLEKLVASQRALVVTSTAEPTDYFFEAVKEESNHRGVGEYEARWANIISKFWVRYLEDVGDTDEFRADLNEISEKTKAKINPEMRSLDQVEESFHLLMSECAPRACLQDIARGIVKQPNFEKSDLEQLMDEILVQARTYYTFLWESCSPGEKLTLAHLAADRLLSPNDPDIPRLVRRGLIVRKRQVHLMNESFRLFVLAESRTDHDVAVTENQAQKESNWQYLKVALSVILVGLMLFLFATQRDLYNSTLIALTGIAAGVPSVFNFLNLFQNKIGGSRA